MRAWHVRWTLLLLCASAPLAAQDTSRVSLVIGLHGPGLLFHLSSTTALRIDGSFNHTSAGDADAQSESLGISGLFYLRRWEELRSYLSPRVSYGHSSVSGGTTANTWSGQLAFGTEYALGRRFGVFGESGLSYGHTSSTRAAISGVVVPTPSTTSWSITSGVGLLFRF